MIKSRILVPRRNIIEFHEALDDRGGVFVTLDNGMVTDVYLDELNNYRSITNSKHIISHLDYYGLEIYSKNIMLKEIMFAQDDDECEIRFEIQIKDKEHMFKMELYFNEEENISYNRYLLFDSRKIPLELFKEIDDAINYFLLNIVGVTNSIFVVVTNETDLIDKMLKVDYQNNKGFIDAYDNPKIGEFMLEKKLKYKK